MGVVLRPARQRPPRPAQVVKLPPGQQTCEPGLTLVGHSNLFERSGVSEPFCNHLLTKNASQYRQLQPADLCKLHCTAFKYRNITSRKSCCEMPRTFSMDFTLHSDHCQASATCLPCLAMLSWMRSSTTLSVLWPSCSCCPRTASLSLSSSNLLSSCWYAASILINSAVSGPCSLVSSVYLVIYYVSLVSPS